MYTKFGTIFPQIIPQWNNLQLIEKIDSCKNVCSYNLDTMTSSMDKIRTQKPPWSQCSVCREKTAFGSPREFCRHLRDFHCTREGGSFVCRYGRTGVCPSLPVDGVSDRDYENHIMRDHVEQDFGELGSVCLITRCVKVNCDGTTYQCRNM